MKKRMKKGILILAVVVLVLGILAAMTIGSFYGNPISRLLTKRSAEAWLDTNYAGQNLEITGTGYDFKCGMYFAIVQSPASGDTTFTVYADKTGKINGDDYENRVANGWNTYWRLNEQYRKWVDTVLEAEDFPYPSEIAFGELRTDEPECGGKGLKWIVTSELELDRRCDEEELRELGAEYGKLILYAESDEVSVERAAEILADVKTSMDQAGVPFSSIDFTLWYPQDEENGDKRPEGEVYVLNFAAADCTADDLTERVQKAFDETKAYYDRMDAERSMEPAEFQED